jgi:hypothetical protein
MHAHHRFDERDLVCINLLINGIGVWFLALVLWRADMPISALMTVLLSTLYVIPGPIPGPDAPSAYLGIVSLALCPIIWASHGAEGKDSFLQVALLGLAYLLRSPLGMIGLIITVGFLIQKKRPAVIVLFLTILFWVPLLLAARNAAYRLPADPSASTHGISQTLFHGLGTQENPFGISWEDNFGYEYVKHLDPSIPYLSTKYYQVLRNAYGQLVLHHPLEVTKIYLSKTKKIFELPFQWGGIKVCWYALAVVLFALGWWKRGYSSASLSTLVGILIFLALFLLQGVVGIPWGKHLYPMKWIVILCVGGALDTLFQRGRSAMMAKFSAHLSHIK